MGCYLAGDCLLKVALVNYHQVVMVAIKAVPRVVELVTMV